MNPINFKPLERNQLQSLVPSAFAQSAYQAVSDRYSFIPTIQVVDKLESLGWFPVLARESRVRLEDKRGFQKHLIRFCMPDTIWENEAIHLVLENSHDRSSAYNFMIGMYRFVCGNGMVTGSSFRQMNVRHSGNNLLHDVEEASYEIIDNIPVLQNKISEWKKIEMTSAENLALASASLDIVFDENEPRPEPSALLQRKRWADDTKTLWGTYNIVQENILKGGVRYYGVDENGRPKRKTMHKVGSIDRDLKLNRALFTLTEKMAELKN